MTFGYRAWLKIGRLMLTDRPSLHRLAAHITLFVLLTLGGIVNAVCMFVDRIRYSDLEQTPVEKPLFIVGQPRSGTTLLHRLICGDSDRFTHFKFWEVLLPAVVQKRGAVAVVSFLKRRAPDLFQRLVDWEARQMKGFRAINPLGLDKAEEDEFLLTSFFVSPTLTVFFPYLDQLSELEDLDHQPDDVRRRTMQLYRECVQRQLYYHQLLDANATHGTGSRRLLSKNPTFVAKLRSLCETFPDAQFVYIVRNPFEAIPSLLNMMSYVWNGLGFDSQHEEESIRAFVEAAIRDYLYALEVLPTLAEGRVTLVEYEALKRDPRATLRRVYADLGISYSPDFDHWLELECAKQSRYESGHRYSLEQFGVDPHEIGKRLAPVLERFGYAAPAGNAD